VPKEDGPVHQERGSPQLSLPNTNEWEPHKKYRFQFSDPNEGDEDTQETNRKDAAIAQLREWALSHGFELAVGHSKRGKEWKGMSSKLSECLFNISVLSFSNSVYLL